MQKIPLAKINFHLAKIIFPLAKKFSQVAKKFSQGPKKISMKVPPIQLEDFPADKANCGNCTRMGGACPRQKSNKRQHNGNLYGFNGEVAGVIYCCPNYTGK